MTATFAALHLAGSGTSRSLGDVLVQDRQSHVAEQRGQDRTLWGPGVVLPQHTVLTEDARLEERLHQGQNAFVSDSRPHPVHQVRMRDFVETGLDVSLNDPLVGAGGEVAHLGHRVVDPAHRTEPVGTREKVRLEHRLQHQLQGRLDHPVADGSDPQATQLAVRLGDHPLPYRLGLETAVL
jgi:hypothetical protein